MRRRHLAAAFAALLACAAARAGLPELIASAKPSVVAVGTYSATDSPRFGFRGTGFVVGDGRTVVTNAHVLPSAVETAAHPTLMIQSLQGRQATLAREVRVVATDLNHDLALLAFDGDPLPALQLGDAALAPEGSEIAFMGFPIGGVLGFSPVTHHGIVSSLTKIALPAANARQLSARSVERLREGPFDIYQLDAVAYPGNSGGPVFDVASGRVIGVINMVIVRSTLESALSAPTGMSYAIPVHYLRALLAQR